MHRHSALLDGSLWVNASVHAGFVLYGMRMPPRREHGVVKRCYTFDTGIVTTRTPVVSDSAHEIRPGTCNPVI